MRTSTRSRLQQLAVAQHGVVTSAQLSALGLDPRLPRREGWVALAPRTWATTTDVTDEQLLQAVRSYAGTDAVPTGGLACRLHGLRDVPASLGDALVPHGRHLLGSARVRLHQTRRLPTPVPRHGWLVAPLARAVADAARQASSLPEVRALVLAAAGDGRVAVEALHAELDEGPRRGSAHLARSLVDAGRGARSAPEAEAADLLLATPGVPPLLLNPELWLDGQLLGIPDGYVPGCGAGWEVDSLRHHGSGSALQRTLDRDRRFTDAGIDLTHVVPSVLRRDPAAWVQSVVARWQRRPWSPPAGLVVVARGPLLLPRGAHAARQARRTGEGRWPSADDQS